MADRTRIEWADATWNPVTGCERVSPGCAHCYAESFAQRQGVSSSYEPGKGEIRLFPERLQIPLHWKKPRRVFVCSLADLFHKDVPDEFIGRVFGMMAEAHWHEFFVLTKRADRMEEWSRGVAHYAQGDRGQRPVQGWPPNVMAGVSIENQHWADLRLPHLMATPAARRFVSYEPALGAVDFAFDMIEDVGDGDRFWHHRECGNYCDWACGGFWFKGTLDQVICGGESGPRARPMHGDWPRGVRDQCVAAGVAFMFKQWGEWLHESQGSISYPSGRPPAYYEWPDGSYSYRVGKRAAGAILDGELWPLQRPDGI